MNKKRLKERLEDIAAGVGVEWMEDGYWEIMGPEDLQRLMFAVRDRFDLETEDIVRIGCIGDWGDLGRLTDRIYWLLEKKVKP